jgi:hypothetical protein
MERQGTQGSRQQIGGGFRSRQKIPLLETGPLSGKSKIVPSPLQKKIISERKIGNRLHIVNLMLIWSYNTVDI